MGFCRKDSTPVSSNLPQIEKYMVDGGIKLIKVWLEVSDKEQKRRFEARMDDPLPAVEAQPDGPALAQQMVRIFACP